MLEQSEKPRDPTRKLPIDTIGLGLLVVWVGSLQVMLDKGKDLDWFASTQIVVLAVVTAIGFVAFLIWELTEKNPIVDLSLFKGPQLRAGHLGFHAWAMPCSSPTTC